MGAFENGKHTIYLDKSYTKNGILGKAKIN